MIQLGIKPTFFGHLL